MAEADSDSKSESPPGPIIIKTRRAKRLPAPCECHLWVEKPRIPDPGHTFIHSEFNQVCRSEGTHVKDEFACPDGKEGENYFSRDHGFGHCIRNILTPAVSRRIRHATIAKFRMWKASKPERAHEVCPLLPGKRGEMQIHWFFIVLMGMQITECSEKDIFSANRGHGWEMIATTWPRSTWQWIKKHLALNKFKRVSKTHKDYHPYASWITGLEYIREASTNLFNLTEALMKALDESRVVCTTLKNLFATINRKKPVPRGVDLFTVCCGTMSYGGVMLNCVPNSKQYMYPGLSEDELESRKMVELCTQLLDGYNRGDIYYMDKRFVSMELMELATELGIGIIGHVHIKNRAHFPGRENFENPKWKTRIDAKAPNDWFQFECDGVTLTCWCDSGWTYLVDNCVASGCMGEADRAYKLPTGLLGPRLSRAVPMVVDLYNEHSAYVDAANKIRALCAFDVKSKNTYKRTLLAILEYYIYTNALVGYMDLKERHTNIHGARRLELNQRALRVDFCTRWGSVIREKIHGAKISPVWMSDKLLRMNVSRSGPGQVHQRILWDARRPCDHGSKDRRRLACKRCARQTYWKCVNCSGTTQQVGLCPGECWVSWHKSYGWKYLAYK